jgi:DNA-binding winged helix-turn-helix (wHTH) protein
MDKRIIPTCIANSCLNSVITEVVSNDSKKNYEIQSLDRENFFKNKLSFAIVDEVIYFEIIKKKVFYDKLILIKTSHEKINYFSNGSEIILLKIPFRFRDLYEIISKRLDLMLSQKERTQEFKYFTYDPRTQTLSNENYSIRFTEKEANIFEYMLLNCNKYITKKVLLEKIWSYSEEIDTHTLETHIYSLRKKIVKNLELQNLINFEEKKGYFLNKNLL